MKLNARPARVLAVAALALVVNACAPLKPLDLSPEYTAAPAEAPLWTAITETRDGNWQYLLDDGPGALDWRLRAIDDATDSIDLQTFLWFWDTTGSLVLDHLVAAADRGVTVRILVDDTFLMAEDDLLIAMHEHPNIGYRVFNPFKRRASGFLARQILNLAEFHRLDHRMHNKAMVIDNQVAIVGGRNLADEYFGLSESANFRDLELLVGGPVVREISDTFDDYWNDRWSFPVDLLSHVEADPADLEAMRRVSDTNVHVHREETPGQRQEKWLAAVSDATSGRPVLYADDPPVENPANAASQPVQVANKLVELFDGAAEEILIISAYLIPTAELEAAVERALGRGVAVRILTNSIRSNNHLAAHSAYRNHIDELMSAGAQLHEVRIDARDRQRHMLPPTDDKSLALHAKALVIDHDKVFIGSANLDPRSLRLNTEMGLLIESAELNAKVRSAVLPDYAQANAWQLEYDENGAVVWVSGDQVLNAQPAASFMQRIEDWLFAHLPIEGEM
jgi:putative cardiolipin synthase